MVKQICFLEQSSTSRESPYFFYLLIQSPSGVNYLITYFVPSLCPYQNNKSINWEMRFVAKNSDFLWKASRRRSWWTSVPKDHFTDFYTKRGEKCGCLLQASWCRNPSWKDAAVCIGLNRMFLQISNRTKVILCSATFYLHRNGKMLPL